MKAEEYVTKTIIDLFESVNDKDINIFSKLSEFGIAYNYQTNNAYKGINQLFLMAQMIKSEFTNNVWLTMKQSNDLGGKVKKGSKAKFIVYSDFFYKDENNNTYSRYKVEKQNIDIKDFEKVTFKKLYNVFNIEQIEGIKFDIVKNEQIFSIDSIEEFIKKQDVLIEYKDLNKAAYYPLLNKIIMPLIQQFNNKESYYSVLLHELAHATAHPTRLNRPLIGYDVNPQRYAFEELIAEISSAMLGFGFGINNIKSNTAYIKNWLTALKDDKIYIFRACGKAQKVVDYYNNFI